MATFFATRPGLAQRVETAGRDAGSPSASDNTRAVAEQRFRHGYVLANAGQDWDAALLEFLESRRLFPTQSATRNAAIALQHLGRFVEAIELYDTLLHQFSDSLSTGQLEAFQAERSALLSRVGELEIVGCEPNTTVVVDGEQRAVTPIGSPIRLDLGVHTVRLSKDGFETAERQVSITSRTRRNVDGRLRPLLGVGTLVVTESSNELLDVVVDAAVVGRTPFRGNVAAGLHSVLLRGDRRGTPPRAVNVAATQVATLALRAMELDAEVLVQPTPASSTIFVDGVFVGNGTWSGALPSGPHRFEVVAPGRLPYRSDVRLRRGARMTIRASLGNNPTFLAEPEAAHRALYIEPSLGALFARSLRGSTDGACDCDARSRPVGVLAGVRVGYSLLDRVGFELGGGYFAISESSTRSINAGGEPGIASFHSDNYRDRVALRGPFAALGVSLRSFRRWPLTARVVTGIAALVADTENSGTFSGLVPSTGTGSQSLSGTLVINEPSHRLLTPFTSTELRFGHRFGERLTADIGMALFVFLPPHVSRSARYGVLGGMQADNNAARVFTLPDEAIAAAFIAVSPSASVRVEF